MDVQIGQMNRIIIRITKKPPILNIESNDLWSGRIDIQADWIKVGSFLLRLEVEGPRIDEEDGEEGEEERGDDGDEDVGLGFRRLKTFVIGGD